MVVLQFEDLAVGAEEARCSGLIRQTDAKQQEGPFVLLILENCVTISCPRGGKSRSAVLGEKLLENFLDAKFAHVVFIELFPLRWEGAFGRRKLDLGRHYTLHVQVWVHDLLCRDGRSLEDLMKIRPSIRGFQEALCKLNPGEIREQKFILQDFRSFGEFGAAVHVA